MKRTNLGDEALALQVCGRAHLLLDGSNRPGELKLASAVARP